MAESRLDVVINPSRAQAGARAVKNSVDGMKKGSLQTSNKVDVICRPHPFTSEKIIRSISYGQRITEILDDMDLKELGLPADFEILETLAEAETFGNKYLRFVIADESQTCFPGNYRLQPRRIAHTVDGIPLAFGHLGILVGESLNLRLASPSDIPGTEGYALVGEARLYDSILAQKAWLGIKTGIFCYVCGVLLSPPGTPPGQGGIIDIALIDLPGCVNARVLNFWES